MRVRVVVQFYAASRLKLTWRGPNKDAICKHFVWQDGTVRNYLSEAISKLHASSRFEAPRIARNKGWL
jgi:two-component system, NarL family, response regulator DesR